MVDMYAEGMSTRAIGDAFNARHTTINGVLSANGVTLRSGNESVVNHSYFSKIDSHRKAHILGFIAADGSVGSYTKDGYVAHQMGIELCEEDGYFLESMLRELSSRNSVSHTSRNTKSIGIISEKMCRDLECLGITARKTHTLDLAAIMEKVPDELISSFILGYFEGNGYVSKKNSSNAVILTTGSSTAAEQFASILRKVIEENVHVRHEDGCSRVGVYSESGISKLLTWMYRGAELEWLLRRKIIKAAKSFPALDQWRVRKLREIAIKNNFVLAESLERPEVTYTVIDYLNSVRMAYVSMVSEGTPPEDARAITGQGHACNLVLSGNLRSFLEFYAKRNEATHSQWEIAALAEAVRTGITKVDAWTSDFFSYYSQS
jgi:hypothetical protein